MLSLSVSNINLSFGTDSILKDITFSVNDGDRVGIVGVNGAGKTTLFKIIKGIMRPDGGEVHIQKGHTVGLLEQNPDLTALPQDISCIDYMYTAFEYLLSLEKEISDLEKRLKDTEKSSDHDMIASIAASLAEKTRIYAEAGGLEFRSRCRSTLLRLGFDEITINQKIRTLSGGQYTRLALARLLATEPDILMLDEPTNHLDIDALSWLESFISSYKKTVLIVSHDRYFLDKTTNKTLHIMYGKAKLYKGNYSKFKEEETAEYLQNEKRYKEQQKEIARIKANIEFQRRCNREHNFVTIRSKEKQLERMEKVELLPNAPKDIRLSFATEEQSANDVLEVKNLSFSYGEKTLIKNLSFLIRRYERVMFLGANGTGKSTLMKIINSEITPQEGKVTLGYNIKIAYFDQENRGLSQNKTVFEEMHDEYPEKKDVEIRSTLALFLFGSEDMDKPISALSGGERARLTLAKLILKKVNLLIMDEPTNHLDIGSCDALENALDAFEGTIIAVSHDRYFINKIATRIIELDPCRENGMIDYQIEEYDDAFSEYLRRRQLHAISSAQNAASEKSASSKQSYEMRKKELAEKRALERKRETAEKRIAQLEEKLKQLDEELFGPAASDYIRAAEIDKEKNEIEEELLSLYEIVM